MILVFKKQIQTIHALLAQIGMANDKEYKLGLVQQYTDKRETSTTKLSVDEAGRLISDLNRLVNRKWTPEQIKADQKRKRILHMAHEMMWYKSVGGIWETDDNGKPKVDMPRVNGWCVTYGHYHKTLNEHTLVELSTLIYQFEEAHKDFLKSV